MHVSGFPLAEGDLRRECPSISQNVGKSCLTLQNFVTLYKCTTPLTLEFPLTNITASTPFADIMTPCDC